MRTEIAEHAAHHVGRIGVGLGAHVAQARRQLDDVGAGQLGVGQQGAGQLDTAGPQYPFAEPRQQPMPGHRLVGAVRPGERRFGTCAKFVGGHGFSDAEASFYNIDCVNSSA